jgi:Protein of unknown function (DUF3788)
LQEPDREDGERSVPLELRNAFIGHPLQPTVQEVEAALGPASTAWQVLIDWLAREHGVTDQQWKSFSPKFGWSLQLKLKKRTIVHLGPCQGAFNAAFILGDRALAAAKTGKLPKAVLTRLKEARRYTEGTGLRLTIRKEGDLAVIRRLAEIKLAN